MVINKKTGVFVVVIFVFIDQLTKSLAYLSGRSADFGLFAINLVKNTGSVWGLFQNSNLLFIIISLIAIFLILYFGNKFPSRGNFFYWLLLSGITGNLIDRIFRGFVVDFINFRFWPVFNIADCCIVIGIAGLIYFIWNEENKN